VGEELERQLVQKDRSSTSLWTQLTEVSEQYVRLVQKAREEQYGHQEIAAPERAPAGEGELAAEARQLLAMSPRDWRYQLNLSQTEAAALLGVTARSYGDYERGRRSIPHAVRLAMLFCWLHPELARSVSDQAMAGPAAPDESQ